MAHKCFISFKTQDAAYKQYIHDHLDIDMIDKSLHEPINSDDEDYIMRKIREDYLSDSTVTIFLIGEFSAENNYMQNQRYIKRELQASLYHRAGNTRNGILGVVLPSVKNKIFQGSYFCNSCFSNHNCVSINDDTVISEFSYNYYIPQEGKCSWEENERYCVLTDWDNFCQNPNYYIELAFQKRLSPIAQKIKVRP
ncbi:TIR domain-containing protein [Acinetobacter thermotolerans]|uniref:TIR domain-containing protein n=1 Tax=Acinetobacter thermotolerans TaxID=3151487 RepID=UPI00325B495A